MYKIVKTEKVQKVTILHISCSSKELMHYEQQESYNKDVKSQEYVSYHDINK